MINNDELETMKAIVFKKYGQADVLQLKEVEKPIPKADEVLIKVHAASINSWDWELLRGTPFANRTMFGLFKPKKVQILGCDLAGKVEATGENVKSLKTGDEVFGDLSKGGWGGFAEYACAVEDALVKKPSWITFEEAAALPQAAVQAFQGLHYIRKVQSGQKVLINGAGGGAGTFAVQFAKSFGAEVTGVDSTEKLEVMRSVGAKHVIDYTSEDFTKNGLCYDLILDFAGHHSISDYKRSLNSNGIHVVVGGSSTLIFKIIVLGPLISRTGNKKIGILMHEPNKGLKSILELIEVGKVKPVIDRTFPLSEVADAFRYFDEGHAKGKVVINI